MVSTTSAPATASETAIATEAGTAPAPDPKRFVTPLATFAPGTVHAGFSVERVEALPELDGTAYLLRHTASGARLMWLATADENRSFSIAFKTPPADDTGVFHILEHSVLCGSDRFPVKEPFVNLLKTSMQTFLNALTFSDKTMYPVASTNERDLENLMEVYLDAVLHPAIYRRRRIFEQEGWHYEVAEDGSLSYNGVVFNEMKGALSDPDEVMLERLNRELFPESPYRFESGGDPRAIPTLTYEKFLDNHARHYQLSNSYTILYGDVDAERLLDLIDERFSEVAREADDNPAGSPNPLPLQVPVVSPTSQVTMATAPENACVGLGYVLGTSHDRERMLAADILIDALLGSNEAPLKRALLDARLGDDVVGYLLDGTLQPLMLVELKGAHEGVAEKFRELVTSECARLVREGIGHDNLASSLAQAEFNLREGDFDYADGVALSVAALSGWLYDDGDATSYLRYEDALAHLREGIDTGLFEQLLDEVVCRSAHAAAVELVPEEEGDAAEEAAELERTAAEMGEAGRAAAAAEAEALHAEQERPDSPEDVATLPRLSVADIGAGLDDPAPHDVEAPLPCAAHELPCRHIDYVYHYFDLGCVYYQELPYVSVLAELLGRLDTKFHTAYELDTLVESQLGSLSFFCETYGADDDLTVARPTLVVEASALSENIHALATLPAEVWSSTLFEDKERIRDILQQQRIALEQGFVSSGHSRALARVASYSSASWLVAGQMAGVDYYLFLKGLLDRFDARFQGMCECLRNLCGRIFVADNVWVSFTGDAADRDRFWEQGGTLGLVPGGLVTRRALEVPTPVVRNEAFVIPANVSFSAEGATGRDLGLDFSGTWQVAGRVLTLDYLWNEVRVKGGAYGCGFRCLPGTLAQFYSYRDPAVDPTLKRFEAAGAWLTKWDPTPEEFEGYVVSTVASHDAPHKSRAIARREDVARLTGRGLEWRGRIRGEELAATVDVVRSLGPALEGLAGHRGLCVFGGRDIVAATGADLEVHELMGGGAAE